MNLPMQRNSVFLALIALCCSANFRASADAANVPNGINCAIVRSVYGKVMKALLNQERQELLIPSDCKPNDLLPDGTIVDTGPKSGAEIKWTSVITRLYENTVVLIQPNQRHVYLQSGTAWFRLDKNRPDRAPYTLNTKLLQARIHGTTVHIEADAYTNKISVLEGNITVQNKINNSVVNLTPGVVYEIRANKLIPEMHYDLFQPQNKTNLEKTEHESSENSIKISSDKGLDIRLNPKKGELIFKDNATSAIAYTANSKAILEHPLSCMNGETLDSMPLVRDSLAKISPFPFADFMQASTDNRLDKTISKNIKIIAVPSRYSYWIGPNVGQSISLPEVASTDLAPAGKIYNLSSKHSSHTFSRPAPIQTIMPFHLIKPTVGDIVPNKQQEQNDSQNELPPSLNPKG